MKKPAHLAGMLVLAAVIGLWAWQHAATNQRLVARLAHVFTASP